MHAFFLLDDLGDGIDQKNGGTRSRQSMLLREVMVEDVTYWDSKEAPTVTSTGHPYDVSVRSLLQDPGWSSSFVPSHLATSLISNISPVVNDFTILFKVTCAVA